MKNGRLSSSNSSTLLETKVWWKSKKKWEKIGYIVGTLMVMIAAAGLSMMFVSFSTSPQICSTTNCVQLTKEFQSYINNNIHPCDDFYRFSCGNFLENTNLENLASRSVTDITNDEIQSQIRNMLELPIQMEEARAFNLAKKFYRACMNENAIEAEGLKKIKQIFEEIGGWPTLQGSNWQEERFQWMDAVHKLRQIGINFDVFFRVSVVRDKINGSRYILGIHDMNYGPPELRKDVRKTYVNFLTDIAIIFGADSYRAKTDSEEVLNLLLQISKIYREPANDNSTKLYERMNISELQHQHSTINWYRFLKKLAFPVDAYINDIEVEHPTHLKRMEDFLKFTPKRQLANFIIWHTLQYLINFAPYKVSNRAHEFIEQMNGRTALTVRWKKCYQATIDRMGSVISAAIIQKFVQDDTRNKALKMIMRIKEEFRKVIHWQDWIDFDTKKIMVSKLMGCFVEIPYYEGLLELLQDNRVYDDVEIYEDKFLQSAMNIDMLNFYLEFSKVGKPVVENWWRNFTFVSGTDIEYSRKRNALILPVGVFRPPLYHQDRPDYMNYGTLGSLVAHEISHIFIRAQYGPDYRDLRSWWSPGSLVAYEEKLECLRDQYGKFVVPELNKHLNPEKTRDEDFADLAGAKISYDTYINRVWENGAEPVLAGLNYSIHQLFWISSAISHCSKYSRENLERYIDDNRWSPHQFRVNGPLQNLKEFAADFACPKGSPMNPVAKCPVWSY